MEHFKVSESVHEHAKNGKANERQGGGGKSVSVKATRRFRRPGAQKLTNSSFRFSSSRLTISCANPCTRRSTVSPSRRPSCCSSPAVAVEEEAGRGRLVG